MKKSLILLPLILLLVFYGCSKDEETPLSINATAASLKSSGTFSLVISPNANNCTFESDNDLIASVDSVGLITAKRLGTACITVKNAKKGFTAQCKVTVTSKYEMFKEPDLVFFSSKEAVKAYETRTLHSETNTALVYTGENSYLTDVIYIFGNSVDSCAGCFIPVSYSSLLGDFMAERYVYIGESDNILIMVTPDYKTAVAAEVYDLSSWMVIYYHNSDLIRSALSNGSINLKEMVSRAKKQIQYMPELK